MARQVVNDGYAAVGIDGVEGGSDLGERCSKTMNCRVLQSVAQKLTFYADWDSTWEPSDTISWICMDFGSTLGITCFWQCG